MRFGIRASSVGGFASSVVLHSVVMQGGQPEPRPQPSNYNGYLVVAVLVGLGIIPWIYRRWRTGTHGTYRSTTDRSTTNKGTIESRLPMYATAGRSSADPKVETGRSPSRISKGDIFISYASADRAVAQALAGALQDRGWLVWWDRTIPPGKTFDEVIEAALDAAKCVIVLWSKNSVNSDWVKTEAAEAAKRRILIPALIGEVTVPLEFRRLQAASLVDWTASGPHPGFESLTGSIADLLGKTRGMSNLGP